MERASSDAVSTSSSAAVSAAPSETNLVAAGAQGSDIALPSPAHPLSPTENDQLMEALSAELSVAAPVASCNSSPPDVAAADRSSITGGLVVMVGQPNSATSSSAGVAETADALAAAADIAELQAALPRIQTSPEAAAMAPASKPGGEGVTMAEQFVAAAVEADARTAQLASLAEQADLRGLERALDSLPQAEPVGRPTVKLQRQDTPPDPRRWAGHATCAGVGHLEGKRLRAPCSDRPMVCASVNSCHNLRALMRDRRAAAWKVLTPVERDALIVLTAMCKVGSSGAIICPFPHMHNTQLGGLGKVCHDGLECHFLPPDVHNGSAPSMLVIEAIGRVSCCHHAVVQMAARETGLGTVESYMHKGETYPYYPQSLGRFVLWAVRLCRHVFCCWVFFSTNRCSTACSFCDIQPGKLPSCNLPSVSHPSGKLLALDLLVRVLTNPMHDWTLVRPEFAGVSYCARGGAGIAECCTELLTACKSASVRGVVFSIMLA